MKMAARTNVKKPERYVITFDVKADPENHVSTRPEDKGAEFRRFTVELGSPLDKRIFIRAAFSGLTDPNFVNLVAELREGMDNIEEDSEYDTEVDCECCRSATDTEADEETDAETDTEADEEAQTI